MTEYTSNDRLNERVSFYVDRGSIFSLCSKESETVEKKLLELHPCAAEGFPPRPQLIHKIHEVPKQRAFSLWNISSASLGIWLHYSSLNCKLRVKKQ